MAIWWPKFRGRNFKGPNIYVYVYVLYMYMYIPMTWWIFTNWMLCFWYLHYCSFSSLRSWIKCHILRETSSNYSIQSITINLLIIYDVPVLFPLEWLSKYSRGFQGSSRSLPGVYEVKALFVIIQSHPLSSHSHSLMSV